MFEMKNPGRAWFSRLALAARKSETVARWKHWLPHSIRHAAWRAAARREVFSVYGSQVFIPAEARNQSLLLDQYEPAVAARIRALLSLGMVFCDVGANLGVFSLLASRLVGDSGRVLAFEPVPANYEVLKRNVELNGCTNVRIVTKAVSDQPGTATIHLSEFCGCHSLLPHPAKETGTILSIEAVRLDSLPELRRIDLLKIDTEGTELQVLQSLGPIRPSHILLECNTACLEAGGSSGAEFLRALRKLGFDEIENLDAPSAGLSPIEAGHEGTWNLYAKPR
jgi:FkbM family methyltransferase